MRNIEMIERELLDSIRADTEMYWTEAVQTPEFQSMATGKEIGHRIADHVDDQTTAMLRQKYSDAAQELERNGEIKKRSMGDLWINSGGLYNPINVKAGEAGKNGQPNLVSLNRLLSALLSHQIDSYYLLIVKMEISELLPEGEADPQGTPNKTIVPRVYLVDMLDFLDFVNFNAGPGQLMLKEGSFYSYCDAGNYPEERDLRQKVDALIDLLKKGHMQLQKDREKTMKKICQSLAVHSAEPGAVINQKGLKFG